MKAAWRRDLFATSVGVTKRYNFRKWPHSGYCRVAAFVFRYCNAAKYLLVAHGPRHHAHIKANAQTQIAGR